MASANQPPYYQFANPSNSIAPQMNGYNFYDVNDPKEPGQMVDSPWREPRVKSPTPSYHDNKGVERQGAVANMMPLGVFPSNKFKMKSKGGIVRRTMQGRFLETQVTEDGRDTPESANVSEDFRMASPAAFEQIQQRSPATEDRLEVPQYPSQQAANLAPGGQVNPAPQPSIYSQSPLSQQSPASRATYAQPSNMLFVLPFDKAMAEANRRGDLDLGKAISHLRSQLHQHSDIADQLTALSKPDHTQEQEKTFRKTVHRIKKQFRAQYSMSRFTNGTIGVVDPLLSSKPYSAQTSPMRCKTTIGAPGPHGDVPPQRHQANLQTSQHTPSARPTPSIKLKFRNNFAPSPAVQENQTSSRGVTASRYSESPAGPDLEMAPSAKKKAPKPRTRAQAREEPNNNNDGSIGSSPLSAYNEDVVNKPPPSLEP